MDGRICKLCGAGGCVESLTYSATDIKIIVYICTNCQNGDYEKKVRDKIVADIRTSVK